MLTGSDVGSPLCRQSDCRLTPGHRGRLRTERLATHSRARDPVPGMAQIVDLQGCQPLVSPRRECGHVDVAGPEGSRRGWLTWRVSRCRPHGQVSWARRVNQVRNPSMPGTATGTWPAPSVTPSPGRGEPRPSSAPATADSPGDEAPRERESGRRRRPLGAGHHLAPAVRPRPRIRRPRRRLLRAANQRPRPQEARTHPPTRSARLQGQPRTRRLTACSPQPRWTEEARPVTNRTTPGNVQADARTLSPARDRVIFGLVVDAGSPHQRACFRVGRSFAEPHRA